MMRTKRRETDSEETVGVQLTKNECGCEMVVTGGIDKVQDEFEDGDGSAEDSSLDGEGDDL